MTLPLDEPLLLSRVNPDAPPDNPFIAWGLELGLTDILTLALVRAPDAVSRWASAAIATRARWATASWSSPGFSRRI
jgi:hypothetical protein